MHSGEVADADRPDKAAPCKQKDPNNYSLAFVSTSLLLQVYGLGFLGLFRASGS